MGTNFFSLDRLHAWVLLQEHMPYDNPLNPSKGIEVLEHLCNISCFNWQYFLITTNWNKIREDTHQL